MPWTFDKKRLQRASAELGDWIPRLVSQAGWSWTYTTHMEFMLLAIGEAPSWCF